MADQGALALHRAAYDGDLQALQTALRKKDCDVDARDKHGHTALMLAVYRQHEAVAEALLAAGAEIDTKTKDGWPVLCEAIGIGNTPILSRLLDAQVQHDLSETKAKSEEFLQVLAARPDFQLRMHWDVHSWVPLVSKMLPQDEVTLYKRGSELRLDTHLAISPSGIGRGDMTIIIRNDGRDGLMLYHLNHEKRGYYRKQVFDVGHMTPEKRDMMLEDLQTTEQVDVSIDVDHAVCTRALSGIYGFRTERQETIGEYECDVYDLTQVGVVSKHRAEHLTPELRAWRKALIARMKAAHAAGRPAHEGRRNSKCSADGDDVSPEDVPSDSADSDVDEDASAPLDQVARTNHNGDDEEEYPDPPLSSLPRHEAPAITFDEYQASADPPYLGRPFTTKDKRKNHRATLWMHQGFPLTIEHLVTLLEAVAPTDPMIHSMTTFLQQRLPPGFPVKLDIPVFPTVSARVTFHHFEERAIEAELFAIPKDYRLMGVRAVASSTA
ncbi:uncharacterized protein MONBRDRAFT_34470 [Monosiga brevicollis MX1]|uniref:Ankyrin repeat domain-containing protein n=1 Tax=Monosiga brevicollis TaxID=81824 RepID=A9VBY7_MONBE|nr:uncharacterized protein MONBRDRAFT_34470 [Monosiga brevicollis MX1]EDQ84932.1 predicted protein [Monosiga brevicollis MX1]|eukprot:XP_001750273.1 hypothetical protein [Monosiga brevicollis MX1]